MIRPLLIAIRRDVRFLMLLQSDIDEHLTDIDRQLTYILRHLPSEGPCTGMVLDDIVIVLRKLNTRVDMEFMPGSLKEQLRERILSSSADGILRCLRNLSIETSTSTSIEPRPLSERE